MSGKIVEIMLHSLKVLENGDVKEEGNNVLTVSLVYPSPGNPILSTVKTLKLKDRDEAINYETGTNPDTGQLFTYPDRILFKEEIYNETMIIVQLSAVQSLTGIEKFIGGLFKGMFKAVWGIVTGSISNVILGAGMGYVSSLHLDSINFDTDKSTGIIGKGCLSLKVAELPNGGQSKVYPPIKLTVPNDVNISYFTKGTAESPQRRETKRLLLKNTPNGAISLQINVL